MTPLVRAYAGLLAIGTAWGSSMPLIKIAVGAGYRPTGILAIQTMLTVVVIGVFVLGTGRWRRIPLDRAHLRLYGFVGIIGMAIPHLASLTGTAHLPAGVMSIIMSLVPLFVLPLSLLIGLEVFRARRMAGVLLGAVAITLLIAPDASLPDPDLWVWVLVGAVAPLFYAIEGMYVSQTRAQAAGPFIVLWMGSLIALFIAVPLALVTEGLHRPQHGFGLAEAAIIASGVVSVIGYAGYIALLRYSGPVFGAQVSYVVTGMGIVWAMVLLGERYSPWVWGALALLFVGLFLVQPRRNSTATTGLEAIDHGV